ncbi:hypothetical protein [Caulobacter hibisci]|uniref:Uncharacterized protein n=1 Tax=Caulobacter hibisci TaxID=2035993 RepID=A0ABS0SUM3_9CAUL|nr:hypothetical protein [Caulobacter hibisci]MBI1682393.1 hypothetical protein [Caulobacter hibisci]
MSFTSDAGYVPDTGNFALFWVLQVGASDNWVRVWSGAGDFALDPDDTDTTGGLYKGLDFPTAIPDLDLAVNGQASSVDFGVSGVSATAVRLLGVDRALVKGSSVFLGVMDLDDDQQPVGGVDWLFEGIAGAPRSSRIWQDGKALRTIVLPVVTDAFDRNQSALNFWSPPAQRVRSPGDRFFDQTPQMANFMIIKWPE